MSFPLRQMTSPLGFPHHVEIVLSTFARRNNGVFIVTPAAPPRRETLDIYCAFDAATLPAAIAAAQNAFLEATDTEIRCFSCSDFDSAHLSRISRAARIFGERRYSSR